MTYSVIKGFHDLWLAENESRIPLDLPILVIAGTEVSGLKVCGEISL